MRTLVVVLMMLAACGDDDDSGTGAGPRIVVVGPATGTTVLAPSATLEFRVERAPAISYDVATNGDAEHHATPIAIGQTVSTDLALAAGVNTIELTVTGDNDETDRETVVLVVDAEVPLVELAAPAQTYLAGAPISGRIVSTHAITSAVVKVGGSGAAPLALAQTATGYDFTGTAPLALGANALVVEATDDRAHVGQATASIERLLDDTAPATTLVFPRDGQAVRMRQVIVRGTVTDQSTVATVTVGANASTVAATIDASGAYTATLALVPGTNDVTVTAKDGFGNERVVTSHIFYGQRLAAGGAHGGAIRGGRLFAWGRNNIGQTGLDYVSHESRTAYCDRTLASARDIALCKATTIGAIDAVCLNPSFVTPTPADSPEAAACRASTRARRDTVCDAAGANAPASCKTSTSANLATACDAAYGAGTPASGACEASLACDGAYAAGTAEQASCVAVASVVPSVFPAPATPYAPVAIDAFVPTAGTTQTFAQLGVAFTSVSFNQNASSAIDSTGRVWTWGNAASGELCLGDIVDRAKPHRVPEFGAAGTTAIAVARGYDHLLILRSDGTVWGCGLDSVGQIGDGTSGTNRLVPTQVTGLPTNIVQVVASAASSYALTATGEVYAWGRNQYGNLGNGTASAATAAAPTPALVPNLANVAMIAAGRDHVLAAKRDGTVVAWGLNASNQVDASATNVLAPVAIAGITDARGVFANGNQGFFESAAGQLYGWGQNGSGNLGIPDDDDQPAPTTPVFGLTSVLDVAIGALQGFAMKGDQAFGWGWSFHGSLGAGSSAIHTWPYRTPLLVAFPQ